MTNQEIFDTVLAFIRKQGKPSGDEGQCYYRHPDDPAIGCAMRPLIDQIKDPDVREAALREPEGVYSLVRGLRHASAGEPLFRADTLFLMDLQCAHDLAATGDDSRFSERFERNIRRVAERYRLHYAEEE